LKPLSLSHLVPDAADFQRNYIRTVVHELGHALNLMHAFDAGSEAAGGSASPSFMNYPDYFPEGFPGNSAAYWSRFRFEFDPDELYHIRHGHHARVIMGGSAYRGPEAARDHAPGPCEAGVLDGLRFELRLRGRDNRGLLQFGEPVYVDVELKNVGPTPRLVRQALDPAYGQTHYCVWQPGGRVVTFRPPAEYCFEGNARVVGPDDPNVREAVCLSYSADEFVFLEPGRYLVRAYHRVPGGVLASNMLTLWVRYPTDEVEDLVVPTLDDEVREYLALREGHHLGRARDKLNAFVQEMQGRGLDHPLASTYGQIAYGESLREFKTLDHAARRIKRDREPAPKPALAQAALKMKADYSLADPFGSALPNLAYGRLVTQLVDQLRAAGEGPHADRAAASAVEVLQKRGVPNQVQKACAARWHKGPEATPPNEPAKPRRRRPKK
jgi:hypothetical protein